MKARVKYKNGESRELSPHLSVCGSVITVTCPDFDTADVEYVDIGYDFAVADAGDDGYFIVPEGAHYFDSFITEFADIEDAEFLSCGKSAFLTVFGAKKT